MTHHLVNEGPHTFGCECSDGKHQILSSEMPNDPVNPLHYVKGGIEVRHVIRAFECTYNVGTAVSYLLRSKFKANYAEDIAKAIKHLQFELEDYKEKP